MSVVDPVIAALIDAAEAGEECPSIRVLVDGWWLAGTPISEQLYLGAAVEAILAPEANGRAWRRKQATPLPQKAAERLSSVHLRGGQPWLHLDAVWMDTGPDYGYTTPAVRVDPTSINAWTLLGMEITERRTAGGVVGIAFTMPM